MKPNSDPCHHVYLGWDSLGVMQVLATPPNKSIYINVGLPVIWSISVILEKAWLHRGDLMGYYPYNS